jgi:hypothetical protein
VYVQNPGFVVLSTVHVSVRLSAHAFVRVIPLGKPADRGLEQSPQTVRHLDRAHGRREHKICTRARSGAAGSPRRLRHEHEWRLFRRGIMTDRLAEVEQFHVRHRARQHNDVGRLSAKMCEGSGAIRRIDDAIAHALQRALQRRHMPPSRTLSLAPRFRLDCLAHQQHGAHADWECE